MTRCLDCGSERMTDQCPSCGLASAAAEVMFRRRLLKRTAVFLAGSRAFPYGSQIYPPLELDWILLYFVFLSFLALTLAVLPDRPARTLRELQTIKPANPCVIPPPFLLST